MRDDDRMPLQPGEVEQVRMVRFRSLGCYPLSAAIESQAATLDDIIEEMLAGAHLRALRAADRQRRGGLDGKKKREGYF